jgi:hypothetical protein
MSKVTGTFYQHELKYLINSKLAFAFWNAGNMAGLRLSTYSVL